MTSRSPLSLGSPGPGGASGVVCEFLTGRENEGYLVNAGLMLSCNCLGIGGRKQRGSSSMLQFEKNPFPGMNPWLESHWGDVHTRLTMYSCDAIQRQLPADLHARVEEYLSVDEPNGDPNDRHRRISPDIHIAQRSGPTSFATSSGATSVGLADDVL